MRRMQCVQWLELLNEDRRRLSPSTTIGQGWIREDLASRSTVVWSALNEETATKAIEAQLDFARSTGRTVKWKLYDVDQPADLAARLLAAGFTSGTAETVLVTPLSGAQSWQIPEELQVRICESVSDIQKYRQIAEAVFEKNYQETTDELLAELRTGRRQNVAFLCLDGSTPVGCARLYPNPEKNFAGLYGGGVLAAHRSRGCYRALLAGRARYATEVGCKNLLLDALPSSKPIVERLGFEAIATTTAYSFSP